MRSGTTSMPMIFSAPSLRQSAPAARPTGPEAGDEHGVIAADADLLQAFVHGAKAAGHLRAIGIGELIGQRDEVLLLGHHVLGHAAVALPAVGAAIFSLVQEIM
jgi:hypothetical protein